MKVLQNAQNSGYCAAGAQNSQKFRAGIKKLYPYVPGVLWHARTELTEYPGTGVKVLRRTRRSSGYCEAGVLNSQKFRAGTSIENLYPYPGYLSRVHITYGSSGYGHKCRTEPHGFPSTGTMVIPGAQGGEMTTY